MFSTCDNHNKHRSFLPMNSVLVLFLYRILLLRSPHKGDTLTRWYPTTALTALFYENIDKRVYDEDSNQLQAPKLEASLPQV